MKLWILSDLHADHGEALPTPPEDADIAVVAGDVVSDRWLIKTAQRLPIVFVAGNHEFYRHGHAERLAQLKALEGVRVLENEWIQIGDIRFIGATLWTSYDHNPLAMDVARRSMNDHRLIKWRKDPWERFEPKHAARLHARSRAFIEFTLAQPHQGPTVVLTHHAPHPGSIHPRYEGQLLNHAYFSNLESVIISGRPTLWVHGHVHNCFDYKISDTRIVCNPRGYPGENSLFDQSFIIDIDRAGDVDSSNLQLG